MRESHKAVAGLSATIAAASMLAIFVLANMSAAKEAQAQYGVSSIPVGFQVLGPLAGQCKPYVEQAFTGISQSPFYYKFVQKDLKGIYCIQNSPVSSRPQGYVLVQNATFVVTPETYKSAPSWFASTIVHDSCHVKEYRDKEVYTGYDAEMECMNYQLAFLTATNAQSYLVDYAKYIINSQMNWYDSPV